ncbi:MAG: amino acid permease [Corynebacteriales bacterium]|nr:amino acid permease [Mycobacteriales bacterium]
MIAMGGAIGVGLFLGAGGRLQAAGPALILSYSLAGIAAFFVMRALGELVLYRPTSGSFVDYAHEFIGPWASFASGWMYWLNWAMTGIAELTAIALYMHRWLPDVPQWATALVALFIVVAVNLISVKLFGELEFWFALIKITALVTFLFVGLSLVVTATNIGSDPASPANLTAHGGFFPEGFPIVLMSLQAVIFAYSAIEIVGITAGETKNPRKVLPKAINGVVWRIAIFYVGSVILLCMLMPWTAYKEDESPFVTVFSALGVPGIGDVMNLIVLTAAMSSCNSGLYSTGRILRSMARKGEAPAITGKLNSNKVPYGGILFTASAYVAGVVLNYVVPQKAFDIATAIASLGVITTWAVLVICQMQLRKSALRGELERPDFRMPGAPVTGWLTLGFLALIPILMAFADIEQQIAVASIPAIAGAIALGWRYVTNKRQRTAS